MITLSNGMDQRVPNADVYHVHNADNINTNLMSPSFSTSYTQIARKFNKWEMYVGAENMFNFKQENPVMSASNPFLPGFDATMVWGSYHRSNDLFRYQIKN